MKTTCEDCAHFHKDWEEPPCNECEDTNAFVPANKSAEPQPTVGVKFDDGKPRMDLLPPEALFAAASVFTLGAKKYGDRNWEKGIDDMRLFAAIQRHLWAWAMGEEINTDDGELPHLDHALTGLMMLVTLRHRRQRDE